jgi:glutamine synthetase
MIIGEYIWIDGFGKSRSKTRVIKFDLSKETKLEHFPIWNYDGSSTNQASGDNSEVLIKPQAFYPDPFRRLNTNNNNNNNNNKRSYLVLCDTYLDVNTPHPSNSRVKAVEIFKQNPELEPVFGIEQEFFISRGDRPIGFIPNDILLKPQQHYYCGTGGDNSIGRHYIEAAFNNCLYSELHLTGLNAEVAPSQWEFQVCTKGIKAADELIVLRYIVDRTLESYGVNMDLHPKPIQGDFNGSGCHTNFSTKPMREKNGYSIIEEAIKKLGTKHELHMKNYGENNHLRMSGVHETASYNNFSYGVGNRGSSIRIPKSTFENKCGYFEDRRPASNMDPYIVTSLIYKTCCI